MTILDWLTLISYIALNVDVVLELKRIHHTKSSKDLSLFGMSIRGVALLVLMVKFVSLKDVSLIIGQALIAITFAVYFGYALLYHRHKKK